MELAVIRELLASGGDLATILFLWAIWKVERRLFKVEQKLDA